MMRSLTFDGLDEIEFEEFCHDFLETLEFVNLDWRKGTGLAASPSDRGRDILCQREHVDIDGSKTLETWFVDCKHYSKGVPPEKLQNLLAWAEAERPHTALFIASGFLSNSSKDYIEQYKVKRNPPFRIKYWERPQIERMTKRKRSLLRKYDLIGIPERTVKEILDAEQEFFDKIWHKRHLMLKSKVESGEEICVPEIWKKALEAAKRLEEKYGQAQLGPYNDFEWGMLNGKLSALRWVLGDDWDFLDT
jgi:hypothetical protein